MDKLTKLSQAIRLGATFRPQCRLALFSHFGDRSCALGAAFEATFGLDQYPLESAIFKLKQRYGVSEAKIIEIINLNDVRCLTREAIADKLEAEGY